LLYQIVVGGVFHHYRAGGRRTLDRQLELVSLQRAAGPRHFAIGVERAIEVATPAIPVDGSTNPEAVRSKPLMLIFASRGLAETSVELMGPALPSSFVVPPAGRFALIVNGTVTSEKNRER